MKIYYNNNLKILSRKLRNESTLSEILLWNEVKEKKLKGYLFARQKPIGNFIVDFFCNKLKLVIEIDGNSHDCKYEEDMQRQIYLEKLGLNILRFEDKELKNDINNVLRVIDEYIINFEEKQPPAPFFKGEFVKYILILTLFYSCFKEDDRIIPKIREDLTTTELNLTPSYEQQIFFDLETNKIIAQNSKYAWDLAFACSTNKPYIMLNSARFLLAVNTKLTDFINITTANNYKFTFDAPSGNIDSLAIMEWANFNTNTFFQNVFIINLDGQYKKFVVEKFENSTYYIKYSNLDNSNLQYLQIPINDTHNFIYFSFNNSGAIVNIEPPKDNWDLLFTQYSVSIPYKETFVDYLVVGTTINPTKTKVAEKRDANFSSITDYLQTTLFNYSNKKDIIGFDWKTFDFENSATSNYEIVPDLYYIIQNRNDNFYKLRFINFYNLQGEKGHPNFEFKKL